MQVQASHYGYEVLNILQAKVDIIACTYKDTLIRAERFEIQFSIS